jgi:flagellar protein FliJ
MQRSKRMQPIQDITASQATDLGKEVIAAERQLADQERQLQQLQRYREDYINDTKQGEAAADPVRLINYRAFLDRLSEAISQQTVAVTAARNEYETRRTQWSEKKVAAEALDRAVTRFKKGERRVREQREQHELEDTAAQRIRLMQTDTG